MVAIPTLLSTRDDVDEMVDDLEIHYLANCDGEVYWISVERRLLKRTEYFTMDDRHPVDADEAEVWFEVADSVVGGHYGEKLAREAALEALDDYAPKDETVGCSCGMADLGAEGHDHE